VTATFTVKTTRQGAKQLQDAIEFETDAELKSGSYSFKGLPLAQSDGSPIGSLSIKNFTHPLRLAIASQMVRDADPQPCIELTAESSRGIAGAEIRSAEPSAPFHLRIRFKAPDISSA
jgi:hypothetical protein